MSTHAAKDDWHADMFGDDFHSLTLDLGKDPEHEGRVFATLVRYRPGDLSDAEALERPALIWVPGMSDYFFQKHVAKAAHEAGYAFYALDLRKCGRSHIEGQRWHYSENFAHYFPDLTGALDVLTEIGHDRIYPLAHSTGGLIVPLWLDHLRRSDPQRHSLIAGVVLNSPWLDMMYPRWFVEMLKPVVRVVGKRCPHMTFPGGNIGPYGQSVHISQHGEWDFDTTLKPLAGHPKYLGWLLAVLTAQEQVHAGGVDVGVPVLTLMSTESHLEGTYSAVSDTADVVLDVDQIARWAPRLGSKVCVAAIEGARHDVFLSLRYARQKAFSTLFDWLDTHESRASTSR
ncbi:alpha/beta hydrolase [Corynebacterium yudongzhengii]|uniref:Alpha/beta hydrolase n=1 Tax=Corynebacterium yudongzhengii TaxID=2080740 RepID=A0A2U1T670_9CORY|nr:alpha/beta hydrolase [Corynebacterium yudongzhengii]AWB81701.1 alpha/beta hydrolase [Corynebacterium yudongzhengii]PWC01496.1 alpha/beta hydrolase [Corynebacterium yudongzhengii]